MKTQKNYTELPIASGMEASYRQKGCEYKGSLYKGPIITAYNKSKTGAIPSKMETILDPLSIRMKKGFGTKTFRFGSNYENDQPGPGTYDLLRAFSVGTNLNSINTGSISRKGLGNGFISKNERFMNFNRTAYQVPGPGNYPFATTKISERFKLKNTSCFEKQKGKAVKQINFPGPGTYSLIKEEEVKNKCTWPYFKSSTSRFTLQKANAPPPGHYQIETKLSKKNIRSGLSANFKPPLSLKRIKVNLYEPFGSIDTNEGKVPGPGTYSLDVLSLSKKLEENSKIVKQSKAFIEPILVDKFGKLKDSKRHLIFPGPGNYENPLSIANTIMYPKDSSIFTSVVDKLGSLKTINKNPGPAYYPSNREFIKEIKNANPLSQWL